MQTDYFIAFTRDATKVNVMSVYDEAMRNDLTICQVYLQEKSIKILCKNKAIALNDVDDCDLSNIEDVLTLIKEYCEDYPEMMAPFEFHRLMDDDGQTTYITDSKYYTDTTDHDEDEYDSRDYKDIVNEGARLREEDNYATLKMTVMTMKEELEHRLGIIEKAITELQKTVKSISTNDAELSTEIVDKLTTYVDNRIHDVKGDISQITEVLKSVVLIDKILR